MIEVNFRLTNPTKFNFAQLVVHPDAMKNNGIWKANINRERVLGMDV